MMKQILIFMLLAMAWHYGSAQQRAQFSQYMNNDYIFNPAAGGTEDYADIKASFRKQWLGMSAGPITYYVSGHTPIGKMRGKPHPRNKSRSHHSIGGIAYQDVTGPSSRLGLSGSYSYNMQFTETIRGAIGTFIGMQQYSIDGSKLAFHDAGENTQIQRKTVPDLGLGIWMYSNRVYLGISSFQFTQSKLNFNLSETGKEKTMYSKLTHHFFMTTGVKIPVTDDITFIPSAMVKIVNTAPPSIDLNAKLRFKDLFWVGASYRHLDSFIGLAGVTINSRVDIGYSYDATVSPLGKYNTGSHEILVGVRIKDKGKVICPSNFW